MTRAYRKREYGRQVAPSQGFARKIDTPMQNINTLAPPFQPRHPVPWGGLPENLRAMKMKSFNDPMIPPGRKFSHLQKIPIDHKSSREQQDEIQRIMLRNLRKAWGSPNYDFLKEKYEWWLANGRPTMSPQVEGPGNKHDMKLTQGRGSGVWQDYVEDRDTKHRKKVYVDDLVDVMKGGSKQ